MAVQVSCAECAAPLNRTNIQIDSEYRLVCSGCYLDHASAEEIAASVACVAMDSAFHWRDALGITPELEAAQPGHNLWSVMFWLIVVLCAVSYIWAFCR
jgi:hypothetical protein